MECVKEVAMTRKDGSEYVPIQKVSGKLNQNVHETDDIASKAEVASMQNDE